MATPPPEQVDWHLDILPRSTKKALGFLAEQKWLNRSGWYLAGGTALALQAGHRQSFDLDFFTTEAKFKSASVLREFSNVSGWRTTYEEDNTIYGELLGAKISFIAYPFFVPKQEFIRYGSIKVLAALDIAVMKIVAISQRGTKRDFFDLYWTAHHLEPLEQTIRRLKLQYPSVGHDYHHLLKSLVYFADAESDPDPEICFPATWKAVKAFFTKQIPAIAEMVMGLR